MFYNGQKLLDTNSSFLFCLGNRSAGKSFYWKKHAVESFINRKEKFIIMRRYDTELQAVKNNFFTDLRLNNDIYTKGDNIYIDGVQAGMFIPLTKVHRFKSVNMEQYFYIIFDEFLPENNSFLLENKNYYYEVECCLNLYESVARGYGKKFRDGVRFIFISNTVSSSNPYFNFFNIDKLLYNGAKFIKRDFFSFQLVNIENKNKFINAILGSNYANYSQSNDFIRDEKALLYKNLPPHTQNICNIKIDKTTTGLFYCINTGLLYVSNKYNPNKTTYSIFNDGENINVKFSPYFKIIRKAFQRGNLFFENQRFIKAFTYI